MNQRPNIIIFNPDQMRADSLGHLGNPTGATPFLDQFSSDEAVSFENAFCQNPVCVPSRCSFATGQYPHVRGHRTMSYLLREDETSLFEELKDAGYHVWMNARNDLVAGQISGLVERHASEIYYGGETVDAPGPINNVRGGPGNKDFYSMYFGELRTDENGLRYGSDDEDLDAAIQCIKSKPKDKPLCLFLGLINPHPPYQAEEPYFSLIDRSLVPERIRHEDCDGRPYIEELIRKHQAMGDYTEEDWTQLRATYLGMCRKVDDMFRKLCNALKEAGEYDNSAIFFFSDHGDYTGDYGISEKAQNSFPDCIVKVPLLIKPPICDKVDPGVTSGLTELVDFYATVMDYADVEPTHSHFGRSLRSVVGDRAETVRDFVCCEGGRLPSERHCDEFHDSGPLGTHKFNPYWPRHYAQSDNEAHDKGVMLRTEQRKYVSRVSGKDEFYDLEMDPKELINRINDPNYAAEIVEHQLKLMRWMVTTSDVVPYDHDKRFSEEMIWAKVRKIVPQEHKDEIMSKIRDGMNMFELQNYCKERFL